MNATQQDQRDAGASLAAVLADADNLLGVTLGPHLSCREAEAVADLLRAYDYDELAESLIAGHSISDEEGDLHATTCAHCSRRIVLHDGRWIDPEAAGDDIVWRETCDAHDTFTAEHEPGEPIEETT